MKIATKELIQTGVVFTFANGQKRTVLIDDTTDDIRLRYMLNGISQKHGDVYASAVSVTDAIAKFDNLHAATKAGCWTVGRTTSVAGILAEAVAVVQSIDIADAFDIVQALSDDSKKAVRKLPEIKVAIAKIELARQELKTKDVSATDPAAMAKLLDIPEVVETETE